MSGLEENGTVRFTVKELLARMDGKLDQISGDLTHKADEQDLTVLRQRVEKLELWRSLLTGAYLATIAGLGVFAAVGDYI